MKPRRIIVCGGRDFDDVDLVARTITALQQQRRIGYVFHGNARGADTLAADWIKANYPDINVFAVRAEWERHGRAAGPIRNRNMLGQNIDLVVAFPGGRGTADMIKAARQAGVKVIEA